MPEREEKLEEARVRLEGVARGLTAKFGADETARLLAGALLGLLLGAAGRAEAIRFLEDVVAQVESTHPEDTAA